MQKMLRQCTADDLEALQNISIKTYDEPFSALNTKENMAAYLRGAFNVERLKGELKNHHSAFYFLYADGKLAGYLKLNEAPAQTDVNDRDSLEIERIYVAGDFQGAGLGRFLMEWAIKQAVSKKK